MRAELFCGKTVGKLNSFYPTSPTIPTALPPYLDCPILKQLAADVKNEKRMGWFYHPPAQPTTQAKTTPNFFQILVKLG